MKHINLRTTHRLLYRNSLSAALAGGAIGLGILFAPDFFFGSYKVLKDTAPTFVWGILWTTASLTVLLGLFKFGYSVVRVGMGGLATLFFTWAVGILSNQIFNVTPYSLISVPTWMLVAYLCMSTLSEPPINPSTAIKVTRDGK